MKTKFSLNKNHWDAEYKIDRVYFIYAFPK